MIDTGHDDRQNLIQADVYAINANKIGRRLVGDRSSIGLAARNKWAVLSWTNTSAAGSAAVVGRHHRPIGTG